MKYYIYIVLLLSKFEFQMSIIKKSCANIFLKFIVGNYFSKKYILYEDSYTNF